MSQRIFRSAVLAFVLMLIPAAALAQTRLGVTVTTANSCGLAAFSVDVQGGTSPYALEWAFGDGELARETDVAAFPHETSHSYPAQGEYLWSLAVTDAEGLSDAARGTITLEGPAVTLSSDPFPPLVTLADGRATVQFTARVTGGTDPLTYSWDLDGDGLPDARADPASGSASFTYTAAGKYPASVTVTDGCGFVDRDRLAVVVLDPEARACHPMAQRIADAVNSLFPSQAEQLYTCEDIFDIFTGGLTGSQVGFGRMWHAYQLAQTMEDLTWEEIRDWQLDGNGWGLLVQLDRFAETLGDVGLSELVGMVLNGEASVNDIRTAVRSVGRFGADFEDALARLAEGASPGELTQLYRAAQSLEVDPSTLDAYLAAGMSLPEIQQAARLAERTGDDWTAIAEAHGAGASWGEITQAQRLAGEGGDWQSVLDTGLQEFRAQLREQRKEERTQQSDRQRGRDPQAEREQERDRERGEERKAERDRGRNQERSEEREAERRQSQDQRMAERLAQQFGVSVARVTALYEGTCSGDWGCVRAQLRGQAPGRPEGRGKDQ
ncbi:MAG TPA: PKD domain-containing protein [Anaerolineales bacterium]